MRIGQGYFSGPASCRVSTVIGTVHSTCLYACFITASLFHGEPPGGQGPVTRWAWDVCKQNHLPMILCLHSFAFSSHPSHEPSLHRSIHPPSVPTSRWVHDIIAVMLGIPRPVAEHQRKVYNHRQNSMLAWSWNLLLQIVGALGVEREQRASGIRKCDITYVRKLKRENTFNS